MRNVRYLIGAALVLGAMACGSPSPTPELDTAAPAPVAQAEVTAPSAALPVEDHATHLALGIVYSANQMGELEPCG